MSLPQNRGLAPVRSETLDVLDYVERHPACRVMDVALATRLSLPKTAMRMAQLERRHLVVLAQSPRGALAYTMKRAKDHPETHVWVCRGRPSGTVLAMLSQDPQPVDMLHVGTGLSSAACRHWLAWLADLGLAAIQGGSARATSHGLDVKEAIRQMSEAEAPGTIGRAVFSDGFA